MKALLISVLLAILPIVGQVSNTVTMSGNIDPAPGATVTFTVYPNNYLYTYVWDCDGNWESQERCFSFSYSETGNEITITPKEMREQMLRLFCTVYDAEGNYVGETDIAEIIWHK